MCSSRGSNRLEPSLDPPTSQDGLVTTPLLGFSNPVDLAANGLPAGVSAVFENAQMGTNDTTVVKIVVNGPTPSGSYPITIDGLASSGETASVQLLLHISNSLTDKPNPGIPAEGLTNVALKPTFAWSTIPGADEYQLEIATHPDFNASSVILSQNGITTNSYEIQSNLASLEVYYWRVKGVNFCGSGPYSITYAFQTGGFACELVSSTNVPVTIPPFGAPNTVTSTINFIPSFNISDLNVIGLDIEHSWVNDLKVVLSSSSGTTVTLFENICPNGDEDFNLNLDDEANPGPFPCPPTGGGTYQPAGNLSDFDGEPSQGVWTLSITDSDNFDGGRLQAWSLEICPEAQPVAGPSILTNLPLTVSQWHQENITNSFLEATDTSSTPDQLVFTLITLPQNGFVEFDGVTIAIGDTFTQADINNNRVRYQHNGTATSSDEFKFTVENKNGGWLGVPIFKVNITQTTDLNPELSPFQVKIYPNPASEQVSLEFTQPHSSDIEISLLSIQGQELGKKYLSPNNSEKIVNWQINHLPSGMYLFQIKSNKHITLKKVFINH